MASVSTASFRFWFGDEWYTVQGASTMLREGTKSDVSTMRKEYTRMRDVAQKRLARLSDEFPEAKAGRHFYYTTDASGKPVEALGFPKLKNIDQRDFPKAFAELAKFVRAKGSTVSGQREIMKKTINTWQEQGLNLNEANYDKTIKILEEARKQKLTYGSDKVVELADSMLHMSKRKTKSWLKHLDYLLSNSDKLQEIPNLEGMSFSQVVKLIGN